VDEALLELTLGFEAALVDQDFGFDFLLEVVGEDGALAGEAVFEGVLAAFLFAFGARRALGLFAVFAGSLVLGFGTHCRDLSRLERPNEPCTRRTSSRWG
jgi:hypothetical protein